MIIRYLPVFWSHVYTSSMFCSSSEKTDSKDTIAEILYKNLYIYRDGDGMSEEYGDCANPILGFSWPMI